MADYLDVAIASDNTLQETNNQLAAIAAALNKNKPTIYAMHIKNPESATNRKITYLGDNANFEPARMNFATGKFDYGSWKDAFFVPRPCMQKSSGDVAYYLDPNDYTKKVDGTSSDVTNTSFDGNAMLEWGRDGRMIWYKMVPDVGDKNSCTVYFSDIQADKDYVAWSFINHKGDYVSHFYTPCYNGSLIGTKLRSMSGQNIDYSKTAQQEVTNAKANGEIWYTEVFCDRLLITLLLWLIGKDTNTQNIFGQGMTSGSETAMKAYKTGALDKMGLFYGYSDTTHAVKVFGMENFWGCQWRRTAGCMNATGKFKYKLTRTTADGSTATDYNFDGAGYIDPNITLPAASGGYTSKMQFEEDGAMIPAETTGSSSTHYADGFWTNLTAVCYALFGGDSGSSVLCGASCLTLGSGPAGAGWSIGAALSSKPLAQRG